MAIKEESFSDNLMSISGGAPLKYSDNISFGTAFSHARKVFGEEGLFMHRGKIYSTKGGDMAPEPAANMENSIYAQQGNNQNTQEGAVDSQESSAPLSSGEGEAKPAEARPAPKLKKKPINQETNDLS